MMKTYEFAIIASGVDAQADDFEDRFFDAGCGDATLSLQKGLIILEFAREAKNFADAITSAFEDVRESGAAVERFEPDYLVTLTDIAVRSGLSKAAISLYCKGERQDEFPSPVARITSESPLWDWVDVSHWLFRRDKLSREAVLEARLVREANLIAKEKAIPRDRFAKRIAAIAARAA
jgi:hypothetical protein